ncbi:uncharacterized protein TNCV_2090241 [Trichonephila clavipes]|nr:uncharacterized protein TNCV_2090241 [Trichonephila clavipes]
MMCSKIKIKIKNLSKNDPSVSSQTTLNSQNDSLNNSINGSSVNSNRNDNSVRLPKLQIDKYFGDPCLWLEFWNKFQNSIDKNETLTKVDKFSYLKSLLGAVVSNVVKGFTLSDDNYDNALILLNVAAVAEWYRYRTVACLVTSSSPVPLKTRRVGQRCMLNLSRAETSSRWCGVVVRRGGCQLRCRPRHLTMVQNYVVRRQKPSCS